MPNVSRPLVRTLTALTLTAACAVLALPAHADTNLTTRSANIQPDMVGSRMIGLDSGEAKGVYCELVDNGFNAVTLTWNVRQTSKTSGKIVARDAGPGRAPTPTDAALRKAIRNARTCGVSRVILKPHLWLDGNEWRAHVPGTTKNQAAWTKQLLRWQKIAVSEHAYELVIGTEQRDSTTTKGDTARWVSTVKTLRKADKRHKVRLTYAAHTNDELLLLGRSFVKSLDAVYATYYPRPKDGQHLSERDLLADMRKDKARYFDKADDRYDGKFAGTAESGFRSVAWSDYYETQGKTARVDEGLQARQYAAFFDFMRSLRYVDTVMLYRAQAGYSEPAGFSWHDKEAEKIIRDEFVH